MGDGLTKVSAGSYSPGNGETLFVFYHTRTISCQPCNYFSVFSKVTFARYEDELEVCELDDIPHWKAMRIPSHQGNTTRDVKYVN